MAVPTVRKVAPQGVRKEGISVIITALINARAPRPSAPDGEACRVMQLVAGHAHIKAMRDIRIHGPLATVTMLHGRPITSLTADKGGG